MISPDRESGNLPLPRRPSVPRRGSAVIITITLLSFLVLLMLSMALLSRVASNVTDSYLLQTKARENALLAVKVAMGQLQKYAGPDQRITLTADFGDTTMNDTTVNTPIFFPMGTGSQVVQATVPANPKLLQMGFPKMDASQNHAGFKHWTAVMGNAYPGDQIYVQTPQPLMLNWLVSGNEGAQTLSTTSYGQISGQSTNNVGIPEDPTLVSNKLSSIAFTPNATVTPALSTISTSTAATTVPLQMAGPGGAGPVVLLVGPATTGTLAETISYATATTGPTTASSNILKSGSLSITIKPEDRYVVAPLVSISLSANTMPGQAGSAPIAVGRYAFAVLDEGVKAKVNIRDPWDGQTTTSAFRSTSTFGARARMEVSQRMGIERVIGFDSAGTGSQTTYNRTGTSDAKYPVDSVGTITFSTATYGGTALEKVDALLQLRNIGPDVSAPSSFLTQSNSSVLPILSRYHDLTTYSYGVLADSQRGGLRRDLTAILEDDLVFKNYTGLHLLPDFDEPNYNMASPPHVDAVGNNLAPSLNDPGLPDYGNGYTTWSINGPIVLSAKRVSPKSQYIYGLTMGSGKEHVEDHAPTWDKLRNFYALSQNSVATNTVNVQAGDMQHAPITPVIVQVRTYYKADTSTLSGGSSFAMRTSMVLVIGNPYTKILVAPKGLNFIFRSPGLGQGLTNVTGKGANQSPRGAWVVALNTSAGITASSSISVSLNKTDFFWPTVNGGSAGSVFAYNEFPRAHSTLVVNQGNSGPYPLLNSGWQGSSISDNQDASDHLEKNWQPTPDPLPSILGSVLFHASEQGLPTASLSIPAGKCVVLVVKGVGTQSFSDLVGASGGQQLQVQPKVELIPLGSSIAGTSGTKNAYLNYYVYDTANSGRNKGVGLQTQIVHGDNYSLYMLDPAYGDPNALNTPQKTGNLAKQTDDPLTYRSTLDSSIIYGRVLQAMMDIQINDGGRPAGPQAFSGTNSASNGYVGGGLVTYLNVPTSTLLWRQSTGGSKLYRGNLYRIYVDNGLTNIYHGPTYASGLNQSTHAYTPNGGNGYLAWLLNSWDGIAGDALFYPTDLNLFQDGLLGNNATTISEVIGWGPHVGGPNYYYTYTPTDTADKSLTTSSTVMYDIPRRIVLSPSSASQNRETPIMSLGYLQHLNLSGDDEFMNPGYQPASQIGESFFNPNVTRLASIHFRQNEWNPRSLISSTHGKLDQTTYYDMAYLLNAAMWDSYFFSSIPLDSQTGQPNNARLKYAAEVAPSPALLGVGFAGSTGTASVPDALVPTQFLPKEFAAARYLMIDGAFNINSTSVEAWKALLAGQRVRIVAPVSTAPGGSTDPEHSSLTASQAKPTAYPRTLNQPFTSNHAEFNDLESQTSATYSAYAGFRRLNDLQLEALATEIVLQVRERGPFTSLAHFINRTGLLTGTVSAALAVSPADFVKDANGGDTTIRSINDTRNIAGAMQTAIELAGLNSSFPHVNLVGYNPSDPANNYNNTTNKTLISFLDYATGVGDTAEDQPTNPLYADTFPDANDFARATLNRSAGVAGWLTQADLLQPLGPNLAARSDTFVIRAYGDVLDVVNNGNTDPNNIKSTNVKGRAWCEVVVQREPDYVDGTNLPNIYPGGNTATGNPKVITPANQNFGRRFRIVSFRWLTANDI